MKVALVGKPELLGDIGQGIAPPKKLARPIDAKVELVCVRRHAELRAKLPDQLITAQSCHIRKLGQRQAIAVLLAQ